MLNTRERVVTEIVKSRALPVKTLAGSLKCFGDLHHNILLPPGRGHDLGVILPGCKGRRGGTKRRIKEGGAFEEWDIDDLRFVTGDWQSTDYESPGAGRRTGNKADPSPALRDQDDGPGGREHSTTKGGRPVPQAHARKGKVVERSSASGGDQKVALMVKGDALKIVPEIRAEHAVKAGHGTFLGVIELAGRYDLPRADGDLGTRNGHAEAVFLKGLHVAQQRDVGAGVEQHLQGLAAGGPDAGKPESVPGEDFERENRGSDQHFRPPRHFSRMKNAPAARGGQWYLGSTKPANGGADEGGPFRKRRSAVKALLQNPPHPPRRCGAPSPHGSLCDNRGEGTSNEEG